MTRTVALIGLGEVGRILAEDMLASGSVHVRAWDVALGTPGSLAQHHAEVLGCTTAASAAAAVADAGLVISAVTAAHCVDAARAAAPGLIPGAWFFDLNSSSPHHKAHAAEIVEAAGGRYVEAALMSPIGPRRLDSPFLLGGPHARDFAAEALSWGLTCAEFSSDELGRAAATKLCRSVVVKGLESLLMESMLAARYYGVERDVLDSLPNILPPADWERVAAYFMSRSLQHGSRRAEEMVEAAATVADSGVEPLMTQACVQRQRWAAQYPDARDETDLLGMLDALRALIKEDRAL